MAAETSDKNDAGTLTLTDIPPALNTHIELLSPRSTTGPRTPPKQIIYFYSPDEWEEFIFEWARINPDDYVSVKRMGGSNDRGADIAAFLSSQGFEGKWDCIQCKHYAAALIPSDAWPEIFKIFRAVVEGHYSLPRKYVFHAPRGCGPSLTRLLEQPSKLKKEFLKQLAENKTLSVGVDVDTIQGIRELAGRSKFSFFKSGSIDDVLAAHSNTSNYALRFGVVAVERPGVSPPPIEISANEARYVEQLLEIYRERIQEDFGCAQDALEHAGAGDHFRRQRVAFYYAEALRLFARDSVPDGTFEAMQDDVFGGVIETVERIFPDGWDKLTTVLEKVVTLSLNDNALVSFAKPNDMKGICHQLANEDRITWVS